MIHQRVAFAVGAASVTGAVLLLTGRVEGPVLLVAVFAIAAGSASAAGRPEPEASWIVARQSSVVPVWAAIAMIAALRAGSTDLSAIRGANGVAGLALARGSVLLVAASWLAAAAGALALISVTGRPGGVDVRGEVRALGVLALGVQALLIVTVVAGPQIRGVRDVGPWVVGAAAASEAVWFGRRFAGAAWLPRAALVFGALGFACALGGGRL